jgi:acetoin utilization deacetylase AcuC-like enzyme
MTIIYTDPLFEKHRTGYHPECAERVQRASLYLEGLPWFNRLPRGRLTAASEEMIVRTHRPQVLEAARALSAAGGGHLDADTYVSSESFQVGLFAAGTALAAVDQVVQGRDENAFCLLRPPGHHATPTQSMGFCIFNTVAIAAHYARDVHGLSRILIVDFDVHHGNGTQDIFYSDAGVHVFSIHRFPFYPGTGTEEETGTGAGLGTTLNIPIPFGTSRAVYLDRFKQGLDRIVSRSRPELILISAGFDAHKADPIGSLGLEEEDYRVMTQWVVDAAAAYGQGRVVSCLEGGYNLETLPLLIATHIATLAGEAPRR